MDPGAAAPPVPLTEWAGLALALLSWIVLALARRRLGPGRRRALLLGLLGLLACLLTTAVLGALLTTHALALAELTNQSWFILPMTAIAILAYLAKQRFGLAYGLIEITVALLTFWFSIKAHNDSLLLKGIGLSGGLYIFVRGCETIRNGLRRR
ncbi:MAG TPA: hypothetical protein VL752_15045 [Acidisoma sp.]|uniref:hypothetical protein n=1 Tax=Acidisoma sp. TaxID=1872115 RepID=UPI002CC9A192|nr:hypothetical protein [Acidisoma sp.]HTI02265.1 hypothetical protein [Acidisoma sp.]